MECVSNNQIVMILSTRRPCFRNFFHSHNCWPGLRAGVSGYHRDSLIFIENNSKCCNIISNVSFLLIYKMSNEIAKDENIQNRNIFEAVSTC